MPAVRAWRWRRSKPSIFGSFRRARIGGRRCVGGVLSICGVVEVRDGSGGRARVSARSRGKAGLLCGGGIRDDRERASLRATRAEAYESVLPRRLRTRPDACPSRVVWKTRRSKSGCVMNGIGQPRLPGVRTQVVPRASSTPRPGERGLSEGALLASAPGAVPSVNRAGPPLQVVPRGPPSPTDEASPLACGAHVRLTGRPRRSVLPQDHRGSGWSGA